MPKHTEMPRREFLKHLGLGLGVSSIALVAPILGRSRETLEGQIQEPETIYLQSRLNETGVYQNPQEIKVLFPNGIHEYRKVDFDEETGTPVYEAYVYSPEFDRSTWVTLRGQEELLLQIDSDIHRVNTSTSQRPLESIVTASIEQLSSLIEHEPYFLATQWTNEQFSNLATDVLLQELRNLGISAEIGSGFQLAEIPVELTVSHRTIDLHSRFAGQPVWKIPNQNYEVTSPDLFGNEDVFFTIEKDGKKTQIKTSPENQTELNRLYEMFVELLEDALAHQLTPRGIIA